MSKTARGTILLALLGGFLPLVAAESEEERPETSPAVRFFTLEDIYGLSGDSFQGAIGLFNEEGTTGTQPGIGFGIAIDDMFVAWSEVELVPDTTECDPLLGGGSCASIEIDQTRIFETSTTVDVTILESTPYDSTNPGDLNDCDLDGAFDGTDDCNGNGIPDIVARATSESTDVEALVLDRIASGVYTGTVTTSVTYDIDGVLFLIGIGSDFPTIRIQYTDRDDGTGNVCPNDTDPAVAGTVEATSTVFPTRGRVTVAGARLTNQAGFGDGDGFADTNETLEMFLTIRNQTGVPLDRVVAWAVTDDPEIDCVLKPFAAVGELAVDELKEAAEPIVFKVAADAERTDLFEQFTATFTVTMSATQFDSLLTEEIVILQLDLDGTGGGPLTTFSEGFEVPDIASSQFTEMPMDELPGPTREELLQQSDGARCQYNDCDGPNPNGGPDNPNCDDCFLGFLDMDDNGYDWHIHTTDDPDGGRAFGGNRSLHWGVHETLPEDDTTRLKQLDAIRTTQPINLGFESAAPEIIFKQQVSLYWDGGFPVPEAVNRGVVHIQFADDAGNPVGDWIKIDPYFNAYDSQGTPRYINCKFDPTDDGNTEDDYFDPADPNRRYGPSSTCFPALVYGMQGDSDYRNTYNPTDIWFASDGAAGPGSINRGTWVETRFNLAPYVGRRIFVRFLTTTIEIGTAVTMLSANITDSNSDDDDGWYIDDLIVTDTVATPAVLTIDTKDNSGLPPCGPGCSTLSPALTADPLALVAPGQVTELSAEASFADSCTDGILQFQFWIDGNANGVLGDAADILLRDWTDNPFFVTAPTTTTPYGVNVRCSSAPTVCLGAAVHTVVVDCPSSVAFKGADEPMVESIRLEADRQTISWPTEQFVDVIRGNLDALLSTGGYDGTVEACVLDGVSTDHAIDTELPATRNLYYLARGRALALSCNEIGGWTTGGDALDRDAEINAAVNSCP